MALILTLSACGSSDDNSTENPSIEITSLAKEPVTERITDSGEAYDVLKGTKTDRGFVIDNVLKVEDLGDIHFNISIPSGYDEAKRYALHIALPGWEGLYFQGAGEDLHWEYLPFQSREYLEDMIVASLQFGDWSSDSAQQVVRFTEHMLSAYNIDPERVYITGYSAGGETLSRVLEIAPELYSGALFVSSKWDGDPKPLVDAKVPLYLFTSEHDSYYGPQPVREAWQRIHALYVDLGLTEEQISQILVLDIREDAWFDAMMNSDSDRTNRQYATDYHGAGMLVAFDESVMRWIFK